jgi:hypothetical protein
MDSSQSDFSSDDLDKIKKGYKINVKWFQSNIEQHIIESKNLLSLIEKETINNNFDEVLRLNGLLEINKYKINEHYDIMTDYLITIEDSYKLENSIEYETIQNISSKEIQKITIRPQRGWYLFDDTSLNRFEKVQYKNNQHMAHIQHVFCYGCMKIVKDPETIMYVHIIKYNECEKKHVINNMIVICKCCINLVNTTPAPTFKDIKEKYNSQYLNDFSEIKTNHLNHVLKLNKLDSEIEKFHKKLMEKAREIDKFEELSIDVERRLNTQIEIYVFLTEQYEKQVDIHEVLQYKYDIIKSGIKKIEKTICSSFDTLHSIIDDKKTDIIQTISKSSFMCNICYENKITHAYICGHTICEFCLSKITTNKCPSCRQTSSNLIKLFS